MSLASEPQPTTENPRQSITDEAAAQRCPRGDGDDPPRDEIQYKSGYSVERNPSVEPQAKRPRGDGDDPPHDENQPKGNQSYPVASD